MSITAKLAVGARLGQIAGLHGIDRLVDRLTPDRPAAPGEVPRSVAGLTTEWLTGALCSSVPGARVVDFAVGGGSDGTSSARELTVRYNVPDLPEQLFTKSTPDLKTKLFTGPTNLFVGESHFYTLIRPGLDIECPVAHYAGYRMRDCRSLIILEDIARTRGAVFGDPVVTKIDRARAEDMVRLMATYHSAFWDDPRLDREFSWLRTSPDWQRHLDSLINTAAMTRRGLARSEGRLPEELARRGPEIFPAFYRSLELKTRRPITLLHHDTHPSNWYVTGAGRMGLYDWQTLVKGIWAIDVSYALNSALEIADRREWLPDLLRLYLDRLRAGGVAEPPTFDEAWLQYRQQTVHGLIFWLATHGAGRFQPDLHPAERCLVNIERMGQAAVDLETLDCLAVLD